jgi:hypothetical protein
MRGHAALESEPLVRSLQRIVNLEASGYPDFHHRLLSAMRVTRQMLCETEPAAIVCSRIQSGESLISPTFYEVVPSQSASEIADHELDCIVLKCWLERANDQISIETVAGQLCNKTHDLVNGRLQAIASLASCLA